MSKFSARIADCNGAPALFIDGKPVFLNAPYLHKAPYASFAEARTGIYMIYDHCFDVDQNGNPDFGGVFRQMDGLLEKEPGAMAIVRTFPPVPIWWLDQNPDEETRFDVDVRRYGVRRDLGIGCDEFRDASWGSEKWLEAVSGWYGTWCSVLHRRYGGQVVGHQFGMGTCGENNPIGACHSDGRWFCSDFSPAMLKYFRNWLRRRYASENELRNAWSDPDVTFLNASVPTRMERLRTDWFTFRDPRKAKVADYYLAFAERVEQIVIRICEAVKMATDGHCLAGSHLGGFLDNGFHGYIYHQTAINSVKNALRHPAVDLFTTPASYENRSPGGDSNSMMPVGSYLLHGKMIFQDQDTRTCVLPQDYRKNFTLSRIATDIRESEDILKRDFAHMLIRGYGLWWHAMVKGMYDHPGISACLAKMSEIGKKSLRFPRGIADGVAMIVDEESVFHQECANRLIYPMLYYQRQHFWGRSGVAWDTFLHDDLEHTAMPDHKLYYFLNTFYLTDEEVAVIERKVKRNGATVIWTYAPGIQSPSGFSLERVERLTGFKLKSADIQALPRISFVNYEHPMVSYRPPQGGDQYVRGSLQPGFFGTGPMGNDERERVIGPIIYVDDPEATVLGELDCLQQPGFCVKQMDGWTSVFCAAPMLNQYVLRDVARFAGLHIYSEGDDVILPGKSFIMIHAKSAGEKIIRLPAPSDVYECYDGREIGRNITEIRETLPEYGTRIYFLGNAYSYLKDLIPFNFPGSRKNYPSLYQK